MSEQVKAFEVRRDLSREEVENLLKNYSVRLHEKLIEMVNEAGSNILLYARSTNTGLIQIDFVNGSIEIKNNRTGNGWRFIEEEKGQDLYLHRTPIE
jgi:hypothetical protein